MPPALEKPLCSYGVRFNQEMFVFAKLLLNHEHTVV
jgi:hypothetical protein